MENINDLGDYIEKYNPFMFKDKKNTILYFDNYKKVYDFTLEAIATDCPKGFFDLGLFMMEHCGMDDKTAKDYCDRAQKLFPLFYLRKIVMLDYDNLLREKPVYESIIKALHLITETEFSHEAFDWSFSEYLKKCTNA